MTALLLLRVQLRVPHERRTILAQFSHEDAHKTSALARVALFLFFFLPLFFYIRYTYSEFWPAAILESTIFDPRHNNRISGFDLANLIAVKNRAA